MFQIVGVVCFVCLFIFVFVFVFLSVSVLFCFGRVLFVFVSFNACNDAVCFFTSVRIYFRVYDIFQRSFLVRGTSNTKTFTNTPDTRTVGF